MKHYKNILIKFLIYSFFIILIFFNQKNSVIAQQRIFVNIEANGKNNGLDWKDAFHSIQQGINTVKDSGEVWIAKGVYFENIILTRSVSIYGGFNGNENYQSERNFEVNKTIIDGKNQGRVILCLDNNKVDGFWIRNGYVTESDEHDGRGGGILVWHTSAIIQNNFLYNNYETRGTIYVGHSNNFLVRYNTVTHNHGTICAGGIEINYSNGNVYNNTIIDNIGFGIDVPTREYPPQILPVIYNNIVVGSKFNNHPRFKHPILDNDLYLLAKTCTDHSFIGKIWKDVDLWGSPFGKHNIYGDYDNCEPGFVDRDNWDYHLKSDSRCRYTGRDSTDMGAFPYTQKCSISGNITYWNNKKIQNVKLQLSNSNFSLKTISNDTGYFAFSDFSVSMGNNNKIRLVPNIDSTVSIPNYTILTYDAALIARYVVGLQGLNDYQKIAADVNKDGRILTFDAALIARYVVGFRDPGVSHVGEWVFNPGVRTYQYFNENYNEQNFAGILLGDVDGNWSPSLLQKKSTISLNRYKYIDVYKRADTLLVSFNSINNRKFFSFDIDLGYNDDNIEYLKYLPSDAVKNFNYFSNVKNGRLRIGAYSVNDLVGHGKLVTIKFIFRRSKLSHSDLKINEYYINNNLIIKNRQAIVSVDLQISKTPKIKVFQAYPNPFNLTTIIKFETWQNQNLKVEIDNILGRNIKTLFNGKLEPGTHEIKWNGTDGRGLAVSSGVYFVKIVSEGKTFFRKICLTK